MSNHRWQPRLEQHLSGEELQRRAEELERIPDAAPDRDGFIECPVLPLRDTIIFPHTVSPLYVGRRETLDAINDARNANTTMLALAQTNPEEDDPGPESFLPIGIEVAPGELIDLPPDNHAVLVQGRRRVEVVAFIRRESFLVARARFVDDETYLDERIEARMRSLVRLFERFIELSPNLGEDAYDYVAGIDDPGWLADTIAGAFTLSLEEQRRLLAELDSAQRLSIVRRLLTREVDSLELDDEIHSKTQTGIERDQRESYLREQMRTIQSELGEGDPWQQEIDELYAQLESANLPEEPKAAAFKELKRLRQMPPMSPEVGVIRTYLDWLIDLPWNERTEDNLDVIHAAEVLDEFHFGLPKAKERILEYIAVRKLGPRSSRQPILCFVGPPGTGKTSLGRSIARALGREFVRLSLGGVHDEAEIRGHRRTYIGALPGRVLQTMKRAAVVNPLFILDEVDKLGVEGRGDPSSALLEVLDPEQNNTFSDHYLELPYDLSEVIFITTANSRNNIPWALLDRMEVVEFPGYIEHEKLEIANRFLVPRQLDETGLETGEIQFSEAALQKIIREYTYEAGVRNLEREIGRLCRKVARRKAEGKEYSLEITPELVEEYLGPPEFTDQQAEQADEIGVATAVAWTESGGEIMPVEVLLMEGKGNLQITGNVGDIMEESARAALSYLKSRAKAFKLKPDAFEELDVHLHIPEGAIPKDGPSAGITIALAIISAFTRRKTRKEVGLTGEITLRGRVLPVGGIRNKVLAAHRAGLKKILIPEKNKKDLVDIPKKALDDIEVVPVAHMDDVLKLALMPAEDVSKPKPKPAAKPAPKPSAPQPGA
jgi:ATP-dependent Lon protease